MAEILLSLTIIGVVAAITLPSLTGNINERTWNTQRKALYARMSQAIALMPALNGYGTLTVGTDASGSSVVTEDTAAETFVTEGLSKVLKINNICDGEHLTDCGLPEQFTTMGGSVKSFPATLVALNDMFNGSCVASNWYATDNHRTFSYSQLNTKAAAFETVNGESIAVFYNPSCQPDMGEKTEYMVQSKMCANFVYDLNGNKGPNTVGKDIGFITALYPSDPVVVAPMPLGRLAGNTKQQDAGALCRKQDSESRLPNREELSSMFYNRNIMGVLYSHGSLWSSSVRSVEEGWAFYGEAGNFYPKRKNDSSYGVWCVK